MAFASIRTLSGRYRSGLLGILGGASGRILSFVAGIALAVVLEPDEYGVYGALLATAFAIGGVTSSGVAAAANAASAGGAAKRDVAAICLLAALVSGGIALAAITDLVMWLAPGVELSLNPALLAVPPMGIVLADTGFGALAGSGRLKVLSFLEVARGLLAGTGTIVGGYAFGPEYAVLFYGVAELICGTVALALTSLGSPPKRAKSSVNWRLALYGLVGAIAAQAGGWLVQASVSRTYGLEVLAAYVLTIRFANLVLLPPGFLSRNYLAEMSRNAASKSAWESSRRMYLRSTAFITVTSVIATLALAFLAAGALLEKYMAHGLLVALCASSCIRVVGTALGFVMISRDRPLRWAISDIAAGATMAIVAMVLIGATEIHPALFVLACSGGGAVVGLALRLQGIKY